MQCLPCIFVPKLLGSAVDVELQTFKCVRRSAASSLPMRFFRMRTRVACSSLWKRLRMPVRTGPVLDSRFHKPVGTNYSFDRT
jgi:hypothetical protein